MLLQAPTARLLDQVAHQPARAPDAEHGVTRVPRYSARLAWCLGIFSARRPSSSSSSAATAAPSHRSAGPRSSTSSYEARPAGFRIIPVQALSLRATGRWTPTRGRRKCRTCSASFSAPPRACAADSGDVDVPLSIARRRRVRGNDHVANHDSARAHRGVVLQRVFEAMIGSNYKRTVLHYRHGKRSRRRYPHRRASFRHQVPRKC